MKKFPFIKVGELVKNKQADLQTGPFGTQLKASDYVSDGVPVINVRNIGFGDIREEKLEFLDAKMVDKLAVHKLKEGDIVFGRKGAVERHTLINKITEGWMQGSDCLRLRINSTNICNKFVSYYFQTQSHQDWMQALCSFGSTMSSLNQDIVRLINIPVPPPETQKKIAAVLSAYDDLIKNNKRRIALLEKMAEEIYREWFVRFRFPGWQNTEFEKGIPKNWKISTLGNLGNYINGYAFKPTDWFSEGLPIIKIKELTSGVSENTPRNQGEDIPKKYFIDDGDLIFSWSATLLVQIWNQGRGILNQHLFKIEPKKDIPRDFLYFAILFALPIFESLTTGATMKHIKRKELHMVKLPIPDQITLSKFEEKVQPITNHILILHKKNRLLEQTKNSLLPRLISGKLSVEELDIAFPPSMQ